MAGNFGACTKYSCVHRLLLFLAALIASPLSLPSLVLLLISHTDKKQLFFNRTDLSRGFHICLDGNAPKSNKVSAGVSSESSVYIAPTTR